MYENEDPTALSGNYSSSEEIRVVREEGGGRGGTKSKDTGTIADSLVALYWNILASPKAVKPAKERVEV